MNAKNYHILQFINQALYGTLLQGVLPCKAKMHYNFSAYLSSKTVGFWFSTAVV